MSFSITDSATAAAWAAATDQEAQLQTVADAFPGDVRLRYYTSAGTLLTTATHSGTFIIDTNVSPREAAVGPYSAETFTTGGTAAYVVASMPAGADILRTDVTLAAAVASTRRTNLGSTSNGAGLVLVAHSGLPVDGFPAWRAGAVVNEWLEISGTSGAGGATLDSFSGFAVDESTSELLIAAASGHGLGYPGGHENRVVGLKLSQDAPAWVPRHDPTLPADTSPDAAYYADGLPGARHLYQSIHYVPQANRLILTGQRFTYPNAYNGRAVDGFNLANNTWDAAGTWPDTVTLDSGNHDFGQAMCRATGEIISGGYLSTSPPNLRNPTTGAWTGPYAGRAGGRIRYPAAHDSLRDYWVFINYGNGEGSNPEDGIYCQRILRTGSTQEPVTINASAAYSAFVAEAPAYACMDYDVPNDRFLIYTGVVAGKVYILTPNNTTTWDMSILTLGGGSATVGAVSAAGGAVGKFKYIPALGGFALIPQASSNVFFLRTV